MRIELLASENHGPRRRYELPFFATWR